MRSHQFFILFHFLLYLALVGPGLATMTNDGSTNQHQECIEDLEKRPQMLLADEGTIVDAQWSLTHRGEIRLNENKVGLKTVGIKFIEAYQRPLNQLIGYELLKIWNESGGNANRAFADERTKLLGIEPESVMDRSFLEGFEGITPGAPVNLMLLHLKGVEVHELSSSPGFVRLSAVVTLSSELAMSMFQLGSLTYLWSTEIPKEKLSMVANAIPMTATENKSVYSRTYILGQVSIEFFHRLANESDLSKNELPLLSNLKLSGTEVDQIEGIYYRDRDDVER